MKYMIVHDGKVLRTANKGRVLVSLYTVSGHPLTSKYNVSDVTLSVHPQRAAEQFARVG